MAEDNAEGGVPAAVRQILQERTRQGVALPWVILYGGRVAGQLTVITT